MNTETKKPTVNAEAESLIYGDRQDAYGSATKNMANIAKGWEVILGTDVSPEQIALCMGWLKICRQVNKPSRDNIVDCCGYMGLIEKLEKGE